MNNGHRLLSTIVTLIVSWHGFSVVMAAETHRQHHAHVHGAGQLNLVQEGDHLHIDLKIPGMDIVGFEHKARTDDQQQAVKEAIVALKQGDTLFHINAEARCAFDHAEVDVAMMSDDQEETHGHPDDHGHGEAHEQTQEHRLTKETPHADHDADHPGDSQAAHEDEDDERHSEFRVAYIFTCSSPDKLQHIGVRLFETFSAAERLQVQFITSRKQGAQRLTRNTSVLQLD